MNQTYTRILAFLGRNPRLFLLHQLRHGLTLVAAVAADLLGFYAAMISIRSLWLFITWLVLIFAVVCAVKRWMLRKYQVAMGVGYLTDDPERRGPGTWRPVSKLEAVKLVTDLSAEWRGAGGGRLPLKTAAPLSAARLVKPATPPLDRRTVLEARSLLRRLRWSETVVLACLLVPLGLPALFFVSHLGAGLMILIASMALFFAGFLFSAIFQPFLLLKMQGDLAAVLDRENSRT